MLNDRRILIAIPAFNEEATIESVIDVASKTDLEADILVIDDCSTDSTLEIVCNKKINYISLPFNLGVGGAMKAAFVYARTNGYTFVVQVDADGQHNPNLIGALVGKTEKSDVVIGSRFLSNANYGVEVHRRLAISLISFILKLLVRVKLSDPTSGFRISNRKAIEFFAESYPVEYLGDTVGSIVLGKMAGLHFDEVDTPMAARQGGSPSQRLFKSTIHLMRTLLTITMMRIGHKRGLDSTK